MSLILGNKLIRKENDIIYIIAEIGQNHQGSLEMAKEMILKAKEAGANCVKFQKSCLTAKFTKAALRRKYDTENSWGSTYGEHKEYLEFSLKEYQELQWFSYQNNIDFTASAMDEISLEQLDQLNVPFIKIGSGDSNNFQMLEKAAKLQRPLIISTGMQEMSTIEEIVNIMDKAKKTNVALLHCVSSYPTELQDCSLLMIKVLKEKFPNYVIGYSGHELGIDISLAATLFGARILERHFTLDKSLKGSDHKCSLTPNEFFKLTEKIRELQIQGLLQKPELEVSEIFNVIKNPEVSKAFREVEQKMILPCEISCKTKLGKSLVAARNLTPGHKLRREDLLVKVSEPNGIPAENYYDVLGAVLNVHITEDYPIQFENLQ